MSEISRRDALRAIGLVPFGGALAGAVGALGACTPAEPERAAGERGGGEPGAGGGRSFFSGDEAETVRVLADYVIPRDERSGSATDARVPEFMDAFLAHPETPPEEGLAVRGGLAWLDAECGRRYGRTFVQASDAQRRAVLDDIAWPAKAPPALSHGVAFFNRFRDLTASGFFSSAMGFRDLRYQGNVARPEWTGCPDAALQRLGVSYEAAGTRAEAEPPSGSAAGE